MKNLPSAIAALCAFIMLMLFPTAAKNAVISGLESCGKVIIPSLFPFFVVVNLLSESGLIGSFSRRFGSFRSAAFIIGITGGYPIGADFIASARKRGEISSEAASKLMVFCNNSGPAFIIGALGTGVFSSAYAGILLYASHILAALIYGRLFCRVDCADSTADEKSLDFSRAFTVSIKKAVNSVLNICGFVLAFSVLISLLDSQGLLFILGGELSRIFHTELHFNTALMAGIFELGNSISAMQGLAATPLNLALAAFVVGWGGISVHFQTFSVIADTDIKTARYIIGRFLIAIFGAFIAFSAAVILRI